MRNPYIPNRRKMKILIRSHKFNEWRMVEPAANEQENELQVLLKEAPSLISIDEIRPEAGQLVYAIREFNLPIGTIDLLAFTAEGEIAIIACKPSANPAVIRKVIGQLLEYGANLWEMTYDELDNAILEKERNHLTELVKNSAHFPDWDEQRFRATVASSLASGSFMLIIVVDEINDELDRIVQFMNACSSTDLEFAAHEIHRFQKENAEFLGQRFFGTARTASNSTINNQVRHWNEQTFFAELIRRNRETVRAIARRILSWAGKDIQVWCGKGRATGSFVPCIIHNERCNQLFAVYTYGSVEIYFQHLAVEPPFNREEKRIELLDKLNQIQGVDIQSSMIRRRPSIPIQIFSTNEKIEQFLAVFSWVVDEIRKN